MAEAIPTRRAMLGAIALTPFAGAALALPSPAGTFADRRAWDRAFGEMEEARATAQAADARFSPACKAWEAGRPSLDMIHWREFPFRNRDEVARIVDLDKEWAFFLEGEGKWWSARDPAARKAEMRAAHESVREFRRLEAENSARWDIDDAGERCDALFDAACRAEQRLLLLPAPDGDALLWKLDHLFSDGDEDGYTHSYQMDAISAVRADAHRLLAAGRA